MIEVIVGLQLTRNTMGYVTTCWELLLLDKDNRVIKGRQMVLVDKKLVKVE